MMQGISDKNIHARYDLLCRATHSQYNGDMAVAAQLKKLKALLQQDLRELARHGSPDDFAELYFKQEQELVRFRQCFAFPALANKTVVAFGGAFSAGKSSLINALLGDKLLVTEVDPTTSLPTYLLKGEQDAIAALNLFGHVITLSREEFLSLTHDEVTLYGSNISQLLQMAMITRRDFPWQNLAFIDTPGYTKHDDSHGSARTDEQLARSQLNAAQAIVWVISAKDGGIKEEDIQFLASLEPTIPRLVVVSRADQVPEADIDRIVETIQQRLQERNLAPLAVVPVSSRKPERFSQQAILEQLQLWNALPRILQFAQNLKRRIRCYPMHQANDGSIIPLSALEPVVTETSGEEGEENTEAETTFFERRLENFDVIVVDKVVAGTAGNLPTMVMYEITEVTNPEYDQSTIDNAQVLVRAKLERLAVSRFQDVEKTMAGITNYNKFIHEMNNIEQLLQIPNFINVATVGTAVCRMYYDRLKMEINGILHNSLLLPENRCIDIFPDDLGEMNNWLKDKQPDILSFLNKSIELVKGKLIFTDDKVVDAGVGKVSIPCIYSYELVNTLVIPLEIDALDYVIRNGYYKGLNSNQLTQLTLTASESPYFMLLARKLLALAKKLEWNTPRWRIYLSSGQCITFEKPWVTDTPTKIKVWIG